MDLSPLLRCGFTLVKLKPNAKQPAGGKGWQNRATTNPNWTGNHNVGVIGGCSFDEHHNLLILDIDCKNGAKGFESLQKLEDIYGPLPETATVHTPSGGEHRYYLVPKSLCLTGISKLLQTLGFSGLDLIGDGLFVVAPPSIIGGEAYVWEHYPEAFSVAPVWLQHLLKVKGRSKLSECEESEKKAAPEAPRKAVRRKRLPKGDENQLLREVINRFPVKSSGQRNDKMTQAVCSLICRGHEPSAVETVMLRWVDHFGDVFETSIEDARTAVTTCVKSTTEKLASGALKPAEHSAQASSWVLSDAQKGWLERFSFCSLPPVPEALCPPPTVEGGKKHHRRLSVNESAFVECLIAQAAYKRSVGQPLLTTDAQLKELMAVRHGIAPSDDEDKKFIRRLRKQFVTDMTSEKAQPAQKVELLRLVTKGKREKGCVCPSEYELVKLAEAFEGT